MALISGYRAAFTPLMALGMVTLGFIFDGYLSRCITHAARFFSVPAWLHFLLGVVYVSTGILADK